MANLDYPKLLSELNRLRTVHLLDWEQLTANTYKVRVGPLEVTIWHTAIGWEWQVDRLNHRDQRTKVSSGDSESQSVAKLEALAYAEHYMATHRNELLIG